MLQTNLIFGIQKQIKSGSKAGLATRTGMIEESTAVEAEEVSSTEPILESSFIAEMYSKSAQARKKKDSKKVLITESFQIHKAKKKLEKDIEYFNYINENFVDDVFKDQYKLLVESVLNDTIKLYQECDVTPRLITPSLDSQELNENQIVDIYKTNLNKTIKDNYTKPLLSGQISELYESEIKELTKKLITEGSSLDMEQVRIYMPFEETLYQFNKSILVPDIAASRVQSFIESTTEEYNEFFEESAEEILHSIEKKIKLLTSMISPNMFDASVEAEGVDAPKMAGISIAVDKNFEDAPEDCELEGCPDDAIGEDLEAQEEFGADEEAAQLEDETDDVDGVAIANVVDGDIPTESEEEIGADIAVGEQGEDEISEMLNDELKVTEVQTNDGLPAATDNSNYASNDADVAISGQGNDHGEDDAAGAALPGSVPAEGEVQSDADVGAEPVSQESVDSEGAETELEPAEEDVSESKKVPAEDKDEDGIPDAEEPHGGDADGDGDPVDDSDEDKSHGSKDDDDKDDDDKDDKED